MNFVEAQDERGSYLIVTCPDGQTFRIDAGDVHLLSGKNPWRIYRSRGYEACKYVIRGETVDGVPYTRVLHRQIIGAQKGETVDHADWNTLNNRRYNLRIATVHQNHSHIRFERGGRGQLPKSGYRGAYQDEWGKWYSTIAFKGKQRYIGHFPSAIEAATAWDAVARDLRGEFTYQNFPEATP